MNKRKKDKKQQLSEYGDGVYAAEKLLDKRRKHGRTEYLVLWRGWALSDSTWEPLSNILDDRLIEEFEKNRSAKKDALKPKKPIPQSRPAKEKATKCEQDEEAESGGGETNEKSSTEETRTNETDPETKKATELKSCSTSAIEPGQEAALQPDQPDQPDQSDQLAAQAEVANEEDAFEVIVESEDDEESDLCPEKERETNDAKSESLPEVCLPKIVRQPPSATITRNPMLFNQLINKKIVSPNQPQASQTSLIQGADLMASLPPAAQQRNEPSPSFRPTASHTAVRSQASPRSALICKAPPVKQVNLVHSLQREESNNQQRFLNPPDREPSFNANSGLTNSTLSLTGNHPPQSLSSLYSSPSYGSPSYSSSSAAYHQPSHQFKQIQNPLVNSRQLSSPIRAHQAGHNVNVVQPIGRETLNLSSVIQQQSAVSQPIVECFLGRTASDQTSGAPEQQQEAEQRNLKSFQETSNAILANAKRPVKRHVVPPNIFWRQNALVNQIVITDVINADNVEVTIRECKKKEFFAKNKKKKMKHKLKMRKLI